MKLDDIYKQKWKTHSDLKTISCNHRSFAQDERECNIIIDFEGNIDILSSYMPTITKFSNSELFTVKEIYFSEDTKQVLQIRGSLHPKGLSINRKIRSLSKKRLKQLSDTMGTMRRSEKS